MMNRRYLILFLVTLLALLLAACSASTAPAEEVAAPDPEEAIEHHDEQEVAEAHADEAHAENEEDSHGGDGHGDGHAAIHDAREIRVVANEWGFEPASLHLHEGEPVNIVFVNEGALEHEIELSAFDFHIHAQPGETVTAGFVPQETGNFEFGCYVPGHYDAGMVGELVVEGAH